MFGLIESSIESGTVVYGSTSKHCHWSSVDDQLAYGFAIASSIAIGSNSFAKTGQVAVISIVHSHPFVSRYFYS